MVHAIVMYSGGIGSWAAGMRAVERYGRDNTTLLFCDTKMEDEDLYRFLHEGADVIGIPVTILCDGRTPWEVFHDKKFLGNSRVAHCAQVLKQDLSNKWVKEHYEFHSCICLVGMDACQHEQNRLAILQARLAPYRVDAPLLWDPPLDKDSAKALAWKHGLRLPRLYELGFSHNNCGGACVKAGQAQWSLLLRVMPERYAFHAAQEEALRQYLGKNVSILRNRAGGKGAPLPLLEFQKQTRQQLDLLDDWGKCDCFG